MNTSSNFNNISIEQLPIIEEINKNNYIIVQPDFLQPTALLQMNNFVIGLDNTSFKDTIVNNSANITTISADINQLSSNINNLQIQVNALSTATDTTIKIESRNIITFSSINCYITHYSDDWVEIIGRCVLTSNTQGSATFDFTNQLNFIPINKSNASWNFDTRNLPITATFNAEDNTIQCNWSSIPGGESIIIPMQIYGMKAIN